MSIAAYIVGTPSNTVTASRSMIASALPAEKRGIRVRQAPAATLALSPHTWPNEWNSGRAPRITSPMPVSCSSSVAASVLASRLPCVSSAPFGVPVVPEV